MKGSHLQRSFRQFAASAALVLIPVVPAKAQVIDFEYANAGLDEFLAEGYAGFNWLGGFGTSSWVNSQSLFADNPDTDRHQPVSGSNNIWNNVGFNLTFSKVDGGTFDFNSVWFASFSPGVTQTVNGYRNGVLLQTSTVNLTGIMQQFSFDFLQVDKVDFSTDGFNMLVDDITLNSHVVPEPSSLALIGGGLICLLVVSRRGKQA